MGANPTVGDASLDTAPPEWHEEGTLPDRTPVARLGAMWYILDVDTGEPISDGWHEIRPQTALDAYLVKRGATESVITVEEAEA